MKINRTTKLKQDGKYWHEDRIVNIERIFGGAAFKGINKFACVLGEESFLGQTHYFVLAEAETEQGESIADIFKAITVLTASYGIKRWFGRIDENIRQTLAVYNKMLYNRGLRNVVISDVPRVGEYIDENLALVHLLTKSEDKRLHFFNESMIAAEIKSIMQHKDIRTEDFPKSTALSNAIGGMLKYSNENVNPEDLEPEVEGLY